MAVLDHLNQFLMLMYKGLLLRKRHYILSFFEIAIPIFVASIPVIVISSFQEPTSSINNFGGRQEEYVNATYYPPFNPYKQGSYSGKLMLLFTPNDSNSRSFFDEVVKMWDANSKEYYRPNFEVEGYDTESDMEDRALALLSDSEHSVVGTVFSHLPPKGKTGSLDYKIRCSSGYNSFYTEEKYRYNIGPRSYDTYKTTLFLSWQTAVEQAFIEKSSPNSTFKVMMQRFPYPPYKKKYSESGFMDMVAQCFVNSFLVFFAILFKKVVEEKANRSKELLRMMGMTNLNYWLSTFLNHFLVAVVAVLVISILYTAPMPNTLKIFENTEFLVIFVLFLLHIASTILFCLVLTTIFNKTSMAVGIGMILLTVPYTLLFSFYFVGNNFQSSFFELKQGFKLAICLIPNGAILVAFQCFKPMAVSGVGVKWSTLGEFVALPDLNLSMVMGMMFVSCLIYSVLIWYLDAVWPWQYGVRKSPYFFLTKSYWCGNKKEYEDEDEPYVANTEFFEPDPVGITPGIVMRNISKVFKTGLHSKAAVDGVSLNFYSGQITALLGRNGAGKTTTVNMLTGLFMPTKGSASISGYSIRTDMDHARKSLGICPQDNILFPTLTVDEHLRLIAGMKGVNFSQLGSESMRVLALAGLLPMMNKLAKDLSGGMKRKLGLALAIIGDSKVLFLDEPTSGMDPENRRMLWDILLSIRHDKTIVLTTHYMEEADILGDRIAIMVEGKLRCCGSSVFLKQKFGTGYHLNIAREDKCDIYALTDFLKVHIPQTILKETYEKELRYGFEGEVSGSDFASMFRDLEVRKQELGVSSFGMTVTTMDDVFLKVNMIDELEIKKNLENSNINNTNGHVNSGSEEQFLLPRNHETGLRLWFMQVLGIFLKRAAYAPRHFNVYFYQLIVPFFELCILMHMVSSLFSNASSPPPLRLDLKSVYEDSDGIYQESKGGVTPFAKQYFLPVLEENGVTVQPGVKDAGKYIVDAGIKDLPHYLKHILVGGNDSTIGNDLAVTAWYNGEPLHTMPMALNLMHTALLRFFMKKQDASISLTNAPFPVMSEFMYRYNDQLVQTIQVFAAVFIPISIGLMSASYIAVPIQECASKAKLLQLMTGVSSFTYWFAMFLWDMLTHIVASVILLVPFAIFAGSTFFSHPEAIGTVLLLLLLFGWSSIPLSYILSRWLKKPSSGYTLITCINCIPGLIATIVMVLVGQVVGLDNPKISATMYILRLIPIFSVSWGFSQVMKSAYKNTFCEIIPTNILSHFCDLSDIPSSVKPCCKGKCGNVCFKPTYPLTWDADGCGRDLVFLFLDGLLYFLILFFLESGIPNRLWDRFIQQIFLRLRTGSGQVHIPMQVNSGSAVTDSDVQHEKQRIENSDPRASSHEAMVAVGLTKYYNNLCAVDHLTFAVHKQECFGLLGINGAGKTSTFMMLSGDILPTHGNAFIDGYSLQTDLKKFQSFIGYCPQFDALIDRLTGREMLILFARIRGLPSVHLKQSVSTMLKNVDLESHADKQTRFYSGGNKRKLSLALALIGSPPLILLDEPTSGVDPVSRRKIWHILSHARQVTRAAVVLCTHSMEECEALCSRLSIMVKGSFRCLGSLQHLKSKFGQGFTVVVKFKNVALMVDEVVERFSAEFEKAFPSASMKDFHQVVMTYHVTDSAIPWSVIFEYMEDMKKRFDLDDYFISGTTLEQIFLAFARNQ